jgi:hypothetical protein
MDDLMVDQRDMASRNSNIREFPNARTVFLDKAERHRAGKRDIDDRALYDRALERQRQQAVSRRQNPIEPSTT